MGYFIVGILCYYLGIFTMCLINVASRETKGEEKMSKISDYEAYKRYLNSLNLTPQEYERRLREWCKKNGV